MSKKGSGAGGGGHLFPVRVYYEDTDAGGVVYYANYLKFAERARTELLRQLGIEHGAPGAGKPIAFAVRYCSADYLKPAKLDDNLQVVTEIDEVRGASLCLSQTIKRDGDDLVRMQLRIACLGAEGRAARLPQAARARLVEFGDRRNLDKGCREERKWKAAP